MNLEMSGFIRPPLTDSAQASIFSNQLANGMDRFPYPQSHAMPSLPTSSMSWAQVPPASVPWGIPVNNLPDVVRFNANPKFNAFQIPATSYEMPKYSSIKFKRKTEIEPDIIPAKIHVTDEKMAAHMSEMHISNNYVSHNNPAQLHFSSSNFESKPSVSSLVIDSEDKDDVKLPSLILCEELRKLNKTPLLPEPLLQVEKPCRALVLWKPPPGVIDSNIATIASSYTTSDNCNVVTYRTSPTSTVTITELTDENDKSSETLECDPIPSTSTSFMDSTSPSLIPEPVDYEMES